MTVTQDVTADPGVLPLGLSRAVVELKTFFREKETVAFTFSMPVVILLILGSIFDSFVQDSGITASQLFVGGMIAGGIASTSFVTLGAGIATDRDDGTLKRLRGIGVFAFGLDLPSQPGQWFTLGWVFVLGVTACSLAGIALSSLARTARSAGALSNLGLLVLMFASGVYFVPVSQLPDPLIGFGALFPLKWMAQGMRSVFLPEPLAQLEVAGAWEHGRIALVLGAWCIGGLILCLTTFRWRGRREQ